MELMDAVGFIRLKSIQRLLEPVNKQMKHDDDYFTAVS